MSGHESQQKTPTIGRVLKPVNKKNPVNKSCDTYLKHFDSTGNPTGEKVIGNATELTDCYYDLATDFFEYGWGQSFHFAPLRKGESREHAFAKHEYKLAHKLEIKKGDKVLDQGCGIGGPARNIAAFTEANITGITINSYQVQRATDLTKQAGLDHLINFQRTDFSNTPFKDESFDKIYAIEATCHAADKMEPYSEAFRLLKPGGLYGVYEWVMTDKYDPNNKYHKKIKADIMEGDSLPIIDTKSTALKAIEAAGFELVEATDLAETSEVPWHTVLMPQWTLSDFKITPAGRWATHMMLMSMEAVGLVPKGAVKIHRMLCKGADGLVLGGKEDIFTPIYFILARKPLK